MKKLALLVFSLLLMVPALASQAEILPPDELIRGTIKDVLQLINKDGKAQTANQKKLLEFIDAKVLPHFDFERMTKLAVGRAWRTATPEQKTVLVAEFRIMMVRTYTKALSLYSDFSVDTKQLAVPANADEVTVKTVILRPGAPPIPVNYEMWKSATGWKAFDLTVEGISLVATHRGSFAEKVQQSGIDGLIKSLHELNKAEENAPVKRAEIK